MAQELQLQIVTPRRVVFDGAADRFVAPGVMGGFEVLVNHAPIVSALEAGLFRVHAPGQDLEFAIGGGFLELHANKATVLADTAELAEEIDFARATKSLERANARLAEASTNPEIDKKRAQHAAARAKVRLSLSGKR